MKSLPIFLALIFLLSEYAWSGGSSSSVTMTKITEISVEDDKIVVRGDAQVSFFVRTLQAEATTDPELTTWPRTWVKTHTTDAVIELVPYGSVQEFEGMCGSGSQEESLVAPFKELWSFNQERAQQLKVGDSVEMTFQGDSVTIRNGMVSKLIGYGMIGILPASIPSNPAP